MREALRQYREDGFTVFAPDAAMRAWALACGPVAERLIADPALDHWYRCARTWFAGVNVLPNDAGGGVADDGVPPLAGAAVDFVREGLGHRGFAWDAAQISVVFPGYPRHGVEDTQASFRYRRNRMAAHVDGLERSADRRRKLSETHSFLLGIPLTDAGDEAGAFVVWRGSHEVMRAAFQAAFGGIAPERWRTVDITDAYVAARKRCFEECEAVRVAPGPGAAYVMHPLALHGVALWQGGSGYRAVAYFRPDAFEGDVLRWLRA